MSNKTTIMIEEAMLYNRPLVVTYNGEENLCVAEMKGFYKYEFPQDTKKELFCLLGHQDMVRLADKEDLCPNMSC